MKHLLSLEKYLLPLPHVQHQVARCINIHDTCHPADTIPAIFEILGCLQEELVQLKRTTAVTFCAILDNFPKQAEARLKSIMMEVKRLLWQSQDN